MSKSHLKAPICLLLAALVSCSNIARQDVPVYQREAALIKMAQGDVETANDLFYRSFNKLDPKEGWGSFLAGQLKAGFTDARALKYRPDDYELILMLCMRTVTDICLGGSDRADFYLAQERQNKLFQSYQDYEVPEQNQVTRNNYKFLGFPYYLIAARQESSPDTVNRAKQAYTDLANIVKGQGMNACPMTDMMLERIGRQNLYPDGGAVHVIGFLGRGPKKIERETMLVPVLMSAVKIIITTWGLGKNIAGSDISLISFKYPALVRRPPLFSGFSAASSSGGALQTSSMITDVSAVAESQFKAREPWIIAQALLCRIFKEGVIRVTEGVATHNMKDNKARLMVKIAAFIGKLFWEASERADTRCWTLLPDMIQAARLSLPEGTHTIKIRPLLTRGGSGNTLEIPGVPVAKGMNSYIFVFYPSPGAKPGVIISKHPL